MRLLLPPGLEAILSSISRIICLIIRCGSSTRSMRSWMFVVITSLIRLKMLGILRLPGEFFFSEILPRCGRATWQENTLLSPRIFPSAGVSTTHDTGPLLYFSSITKGTLSFLPEKKSRELKKKGLANSTQSEILLQLTTWCSLAITLRFQRLEFGREKLTKGPDVIRHACCHRRRALPPARTNRAGR